MGKCLPSELSRVKKEDHERMTGAEKGGEWASIGSCIRERKQRNSQKARNSSEIERNW